jgi:hypothetical protein
MSLIILGEHTTLSRASSKFQSLRTTVPASVVKQWRLKEGDMLDWSWEALGKGEMILVIKKVVGSNSKK